MTLPTTSPTVVAWITEGTWQATVDATARAAVGLDPVEVVLLHVVDAGVSEALHGAFGGLLGRGGRDRDPGDAVATLADAESVDLLAAAETRLGRPARREVRVGRVEREVVAGCADATLLVCARDGDHSRLGPRSLGPRTRFVVDHAPCPVLLIWPDETPGLRSMPRPPPH
ncbi:MAG TPA: universal stress protein [Pseudonocardia sp.]|nr:universal stress protein [Pseudonocardia sp.]